MRTGLALALAIFLASSSAHADRAGVWSLGVTLDGRATGKDFDTASQAPVSYVGGGRLSVGFEDAPMAMPPGGLYETDVGLVPELFAGFLSDDTRAEGYVGAGLRGELRIASMVRRANLRTTIYVAGRALVIGKDRDGATEFVLGEYISHAGDRQRFGWEGGAMIRPRPNAAADERAELHALVNIYVSWR